MSEDLGPGSGRVLDPGQSRVEMCTRRMDGLFHKLVINVTLKIYHFIR